jgi:hypothetical protein
VPDDRLVAATLLLQSAHPGSAVFVATSDLNLRTKPAPCGCHSSSLRTEPLALAGPTPATAPGRSHPGRPATGAR